MTDILDVARIESNTLELNESNFDLNQEIENVIREIIESTSWTETGRNVSFVFEPENSTCIFGDRARINQVIQNIINNAVKFTATGTINIKVEENNQRNEVTVTVSDTGTGIDREILPRMFMKFATKSKDGTGLGLFISKTIIGAHGGNLEAYNNVDGPGATFRFTIPLVNNNG